MFHTLMVTGRKESGMVTESTLFKSVDLTSVPDSFQYKQRERVGSRVQSEKKGRLQILFKKLPSLQCFSLFWDTKLGNDPFQHLLLLIAFLWFPPLISLFLSLSVFFGWNRRLQERQLPFLFCQSIQEVVVTESHGIRINSWYRWQSQRKRQSQISCSSSGNYHRYCCHDCLTMMFYSFFYP